MDISLQVLESLKHCPPDTIFLAAVSGGADSMAMLTALCEIPELRLYVLHVEHGLRPAQESQGDADFVRVFCKERGIKCFIKNIPPGKVADLAQRKKIGIEAAARFYRFKALYICAARLTAQVKSNIRILIAHTKDDALELSLMRILRGSGPAGLAIMPSETGDILRPLISVTREEVITYLKTKGIPWREDATNADDIFLRNRIRNRLIPLLNETFPSWKSGITAMAQTQSLTAKFITEEAKTRIKWETQPSEKGDPRLPNSSVAGKPVFFTDADNFFSQPLIIREEAIFLTIDELLTKNSRTVKRAVVRKFCEGVVTAADLGRVRVRRDGEKVIVSCRRKEFFEKGVSLLLNHRVHKIFLNLCVLCGLHSRICISIIYQSLPVKDL